MFERIGLRDPPCGVPSSLTVTIHSIMMPDFRYLRINLTSRLSLIRFASVPISLSWFTLSKNFSKSISITNDYLPVYILLLSLPRHGHFDLVETHNYGLKMLGHIERLILEQ